VGKVIDINNEEQILKECDFNYFYNSKECSRELCMFFNDIAQNEDFDKRQAYIDLGRIGITLNQQDQKIKELEHRLANCIEPKFKVGQEVWVQWKGDIVKRKVIRLIWDYNEVIEYRISGGMYLVSYWEDEVFATEEEARAKLREMQDGSICD
jgi:hypothetical protein